MVLVVGHTGIAHIDRKGHQEELDRGPQQPCPLPAEPGLHIELSGRQPALAGPVSVHTLPSPMQEP